MSEHAREEPAPAKRPDDGPPRELDRGAPRLGSEETEWEEYARRLQAAARTDGAQALVDDAVSKMREDPGSAEAVYRDALGRL